MSDSRRGAVLLVVLVCFAIVSTLLVLVARRAVLERRAAEGRAWRLQAEWLGEAALDRAAARLAADAKYAGETWNVAAAELGASRGGVARIRVTPDAGDPNRRLVAVEADYPDDPVHRCRWRKQMTVDCPDKPPVEKKKGKPQ